MTRSPNRMLGLILGAVFVVLGGVGFVVSSHLPFFDAEGAQFAWILQVNGLQNTVHILVGAALAMAALSNERASAGVNAWTGAFLLLFGLAGLFLVGEPFNVFGLNSAVNVVHFAASAVLLAAGLGADSFAASRTETPDPLARP